jgi:hypothetical protein
MEDGTVSNPGLAFADDLDTGLFRPGANQLAIATNGVERIEFGASEVVVNDGGADVDFRVEGDTEANLLVVDAGNDRIGIAESAPGTLVEIGGETPYVTLKNSTEEDTDGGRESRLIFEGEQSGGEISSLAQIEVSHDGSADDEKGQFILKINSGADGSSPSEALRVNSSGDLAFDSGYGSVATAYGCRVWVNFDGTGTVAIRESGNVSSITDNGTGDYTVNFTTVLADANYCVSGSAVLQATGAAPRIMAPKGTNGFSSSNCQIRTLDDTGAYNDCAAVSVAIFR